MRQNVLSMMQDNAEYLSGENICQTRHTAKMAKIYEEARSNIQEKMELCCCSKRF